MREAGQQIMTFGRHSGVQVQPTVMLLLRNNQATTAIFVCFYSRSQTQSSGFLQQQPVALMLFMNNSPEYHTERCAALAPDVLPSTDMLSTLLRWIWCHVTALPDIGLLGCSQ